MKHESKSLVELLLFANLNDKETRALIFQVVKENTFFNQPNINEIVGKKQAKYNNPNPSLAEPLLAPKKFFDSSANKNQVEPDSLKPKKI